MLVAEVEKTYTVKFSDYNGSVELESFDSLEDAESYAENEAALWSEDYSGTIEVWDDEDDLCLSEYEALETVEEPSCEFGEHEWESPYELLGGLKENPGVQGNGGGVIIKEVCRCGCTKVTDTWGSHPLYPAKQGYKVVSYNYDMSSEIEEYYSAQEE